MEHDWRRLIHKAHLAGLRVFESNHLVLITDRASRVGDALEGLPEIFDEAVGIWAKHYRIPLSAVLKWKACGCLVVDRERFRKAGLLPDAIPDFTNGYCDHYRFWLTEQSNPAYRRHLLLHEGVHAFTATLLNLNTPHLVHRGYSRMVGDASFSRGAAPIPAHTDSSHAKRC